MVLPACSSVFEFYHPAVDELDDNGFKQLTIYFYTDSVWFKINLFIGINRIKTERFLQNLSRVSPKTTLSLHSQKILLAWDTAVTKRVQHCY